MSNPRVTAIIPAAGTSTRMGLSVPKPLIEVCGRPILHWTLDSITKSGLVTDIVVMVPASNISAFKESLNGFSNVEIAIGGSTRQESVKLGVELIGQRKTVPDLVLIHDAARCLVTAELIQLCIESAQANGAITAAIPVVDSIVEVSSTLNIEKSLPREKLWAVQTPQIFTYDLISRAHTNGSPGATDDASLVEPLHPVTIVNGDPENIKVTRPLDLLLAAQILKSRGTN